MNSELQQAMDAATVPFLGGAIDQGHARMKSWRYFLEINSVCNLHCPTCTKGNQAGYEHQTGIMDPVLMYTILDKIKSENPNAIVFLYGNSEPFLHPYLPECIRGIRRKGLHPEFSTNLNIIKRVDEVLAERPDLIIISLSGFTQEVYEKGHAGGNIERVKENMRTLAEANNAITEEHRVKILVNYHVYNDNAHEIEPMQEYARNLGIGFFTSLARAISMENSIQYCRSNDPEATPFESHEGECDWNTAFPPVGDTYIATMARLKIPPTQAREMYQHIPVADVCPVGAGSIFTFIRHDGKTQLCACTADRRATLKDYLDTTPDELIGQRTGHGICKQCIKYRLNLYFMIADREKWMT
jgi:MoaA/NifB/PqqE/SkfB family radical SAM enzyme